MRILLVGALPPPIHGLSIANAKFVELAGRDHQVRAVDAQGAAADPRAVGTFAWSKVFGFVGVYLGLSRIPWCQVVYLTPGQTFLGVAKMAPFVLVARLLRKPVVFHLHGGALGKVYQALRGPRRLFFRAVVSSCTQAIVLAPSLRAAFAGLLPESAVEVVPNFADRAWFALPRTYPERFEAERPLRVLYLSNLIPSKGILSLLDAVKTLVQEGAPIELDVAGHAEPEILARMEREVGICRSIRWHGTVSGDAKARLLGSCDLLALPTTYPMEGQPICILEAMAAGMNILATRHAAIPEIFAGDTAFLVPDGSPASVREGLRAALEAASAFAGRGAAHRAQAEAEYSEEAFVRRILSVLD